MELVPRPEHEAQAATLLAEARAVARRAVDIRMRARESVVRWAWAKEGASVDRPEPLARERLGYGTRVTWLKEEPKAGERAEGYGYDEHGDIVWSIARYPEFDGHAYFRRLADRVESVFMGDDGVVRRAKVTRIDGGVVIGTAAVTDRGGCDWEIYDYEAGRLVRVYEYGDHLHPDVGRVAGGSVTTVEYDDLGRLSRIVDASPHTTEVVYRSRR